ncbi:hypothetical protein [Micromonospora chersina]|uniref:hypothetical protein n=1 Tax=Micromonospora chersina TaxID=47854 RepID=UPI00378B2A2B
MNAAKRLNSDSELAGGAMAESAKTVAERAEERLEEVAENVRQRFDRVTKGGFTDKVREGRFMDQVDHGVDRARDDERRKEQGGST